MAAPRLTCPALLAIFLLLPAVLTGCGRLAGVPAVATQTQQFGAPGRVLPEALVANGACGAEAALALVGDHFTALADLSLPGDLRVLWPGQRVTDEVQPLRMNAQVSDSGTIRRVFCG